MNASFPTLSGEQVPSRVEELNKTTRQEGAIPHCKTSHKRVMKIDRSYHPVKLWHMFDPSALCWAPRIIIAIIQENMSNTRLIKVLFRNIVTFFCKGNYARWNITELILYRLESERHGSEMAHNDAEHRAKLLWRPCILLGLDAK